MSQVWILIANSATAKILEAEDNTKLKEIEFLEHPESRLHTRDLVSDRQGRGNESSGMPLRHAKEPQTDPKQLEFILFAKHLSKHLQEANNKGKFKKLYIAASPHFLGILRQEIGSNVNQLIAEEIGKDMTHMSMQEIRSNLPLVL